MATKQGKNLPLDTDFFPNQTKPKEFDGPHVWQDGEYVKVPASTLQFPKSKYHADYVHEPKDGKELGFTEMVQIVHSEDEEKQLGDDWKDAPQMITAPDSKQVAERKKQAGSNWRSAANIPDQVVNEHHVAFAQSQGMTNIANELDLYKFLGTLTGAQMKSFMADAERWQAPKKGPGRPKSDAA